MAEHVALAPRCAAAQSTTHEVVVAPVTITPTKPLTPTHVKGLLWTDLLVRATSDIMPTRLMWNSRTAHLTTQTTAFWAHLDRVAPGADWSAESEAAIGERYVDFHAHGTRPDPDELAAYFTRVEAGWIHPAGRRMLDLWRDQMARLGIADPGLTADRPLPWDTGQVLAALDRRGLLIDHRRFGGPAYLDGVRYGMPIRRLVSADGTANYLMPILRDLLPMVRPDRLFLLVCDAGILADYLLVDRVLAEFGAATRLVALGRVPVDGQVRSSKHGGWSGVTLGDLAATSGSAGVRAYRLGMRLYFVGMLGRRSPQSFRPDLVRRAVGRAARMLGGAAGDDPGHVARLRALARHGYVDPYRLTSGLLGRSPAPLSSQMRDILT
ncbi:hypothetical protein [Mangrovihabitans endophyticus]|uniref:hypothetical protein n=1 Tax=Mangrovihabitans endophyticus TaxID=1751298 RepID=UPI00166DCB87|nr:hypothetical protein [Mangrovihabitans endophyticus]